MSIFIIYNITCQGIEVLFLIRALSIKVLGEAGGGGGSGGAVVTHSPPTSEDGGSNPGPYVGKLVVCLPMVGSLQYRILTPTVCTGFLRPQNYPS